MSETANESFWRRQCAEMTPRDRRNQRRLILLLQAWAVVFVSATWLVAREAVTAGPAGFALAAAPSIVAVFAALAYGRFVFQADELQRTIHLHGLALAVAAGFVAWPAVKLFGLLGVPVDGWPDATMLVMVAFYLVGIFWSRRRYV